MSAFHPLWTLGRRLSRGQIEKPGRCRPGFSSTRLPRGGRVQRLLTYRLQLVEDALRLRIALDLLDQGLLMRLVERPDAAEEQRGNRYKIFGRRVIDESAELTDVGSSHHGNPPFAGKNSRNHENGLEVGKLWELDVRNDSSVFNVD